MSDFVLINCSLQTANSAEKNQPLCSYYIPLPSAFSCASWIQTIYEYFPYENDFFYFRLKVFGNRLGWKGDNNFYWLDLSSFVNDSSSFEAFLEDSRTVDLQLILVDATRTELDFETIIVPEHYDEYLESIQTEESIFQREELHVSGFATSGPASTAPSTSSRSARAAPPPAANYATSSSAPYQEEPQSPSAQGVDDASFYDYQSEPVKTSSSSGGAAAAGPLNMHAMKKGVSSLWKSVKATADKLQSTVISAITVVQLPQSVLDTLTHLSELVLTDFDYSNPFHVDLLKQLWKGTIQPLVNEGFPSPDASDGSISSNHWKQAGWQNPNIAKDLKTTGLLALHSVVYFSEEYPEVAHRLLQENRNNIKTNYPFAIVAINLTLLLIELFSLRDQKYRETTADYWDIFDQEAHYYEIFMMCFVHLDQSWRQKQANRSQFGAMINEIKGMIGNVLKRSPRSFIQFRQIAKEEGFLL